MTATPSAPAETSGRTPTDSADGTRILAIGDSYTGGTPEGGQGEAGWPALLEQRIAGTEVEIAATGDAGYVTTAGEPTLSDLVAEADLTDVDLVILFGSRFDAAGIADRVARQRAGPSPQSGTRLRKPLWSSSDPRGRMSLPPRVSATTGTSSAARQRPPPSDSSTR